ncbi:MAG: amidohydrolase, partial [Limisphaerales bacterium]
MKHSSILLLATLIAGTLFMSTPVIGAPKAAKKKGKEVDEAAKWDVEKPSEHTSEQAIDTTEGTWVNLDVSPDGKQIVFDLLGDLYVMPIGGSETPRKITKGIAWDMQPRFSPDGKTIAFTSDRTGKNGFGGDNIWTIGSDGKDLKQISAETYRLVTGPAWRPDGEYIVARKHFVSRRSLGAGEMWLYHRNGGTTGLQLTKKLTEQKDSNEPIFSPNGKYLYYSEDASPGKSFEYSKDSNQQIYIIKQLELEKGETERLITGPGGACRPTPSPDGKTIAFVRRVDGKTGLHLFDPESGAVRLVYDDLERDMQETWAIHGVYPTFAWTPDARSIVVWARGKIRRINIATGKANVIPFRINDTRTVVQSLRFPQKVAPGKFDVKMLRWLRTSPAGDQIAYQALGHIYLRDLPDGKPRRLTEQDDRFEFYPQFTPNGDGIVYTTWDDEELGDVRLTSIRGKEQGSTRILVKQPGHYTSPALSPDGKTLVYSKRAGGWLRSPLWSRHTGLYRVPVAGGKTKLVAKTQATATFGPENDRVYLTRTKSDAGGDNRQFYSIDLDGNEECVHFSGKWATDFCLSPDGNWIAFIERFNVYVAPFLRTGKMIAVGPNTKSLPLKKVSSTAGESIHFSGDSKRLHWSLGPSRFTRELSDTFAFLEGAPEKLPPPETKGTNVGFKTSHHRPRGTLALVGGTIVTMK